MVAGQDQRLGHFSPEFLSSLLSSCLPYSGPCSYQIRRFKSKANSVSKIAAPEYLGLSPGDPGNLYDDGQVV